MAGELYIQKVVFCSDKDMEYGGDTDIRIYHT